MNILNPKQIENESMRIISDIIGDYPGSAENLPIIKRVIHATADFDFLNTLYFSDNAVNKARETLKNGADIVTDTLMLSAGISKNYGVKIRCYVADDATQRAQS